MKILGIDHFTINVTSMEKSIYFYGNTMQLQKGDFVDMGDHMIQYFKLDDRNTLELIQYKYETERCKMPIESKGIYRHLAIRVENIQDAYACISRNPDVELLMQPAYCKNLRFTNFLLKDPNGVELEILERQMNVTE